MAFYPAYIPTLNRYDHFRNCVESLARVGVKSAKASFTPKSSS